MKTLLLASFLLLFCKTYAQDTIYSIAYTGPCPFGTAYCTYDFDDRDTANHFFIDPTQVNNLWEIGTPVKTVFNSAYSSPLAIVTDTLNTYPVNNASSFSFTIFSDDVTYIWFSHQMNSDSLSDGGVVEYSTDGGTTWDNVINSPYTLNNFYSGTSTIASNSNNAGFTGTSGWDIASIQSYAFNYVKFRFTFTSDNVHTNKDGWMIDDIQINCLGTGINEIGRNSAIHVSPNPTSDFITIHSDYAMKFSSIRVTDAVGKTVLTTTKTTIDLSGLESGVYFIEVNTDKHQYLSRVIRK